MSDNKYSTCPYRGVQRDRLWKNVFSGDMTEFNLDARAGFKITRTTKIATAGSCFAQHLARHLELSGFNYFKTETCPGFIPLEIARSFNYNLFSARYGNIYTARQLLQLIQRAYGEFTPIDDKWIDGTRFLDPLRPFIQPDGFETFEALSFDREQHMASVRRLVEESDVFVFTLGLTEAWIDQRDGTVFPVCPGCGAGEHDNHIHKFVNFDYQQTLDDLGAAIDLMVEHNKGLRFILTVSPVPLAATAADQHILLATTYSKSVLRAVAGKASEQRSRYVAYFPSFEIITGSYSRGAYFETDLRAVTEAGVSHVMREFLRNFAEGGDSAVPKASSKRCALDQHMIATAAICDEEKMAAGIE